MRRTDILFSVCTLLEIRTKSSNLSFQNVTIVGRTI